MHKIIRQFHSDIVTYSPYCMEEAKAQLRAEVSTTRLGWLWWILGPLLQMLVYFVIFGYIFRAATQYYPAFIFIGITAWRFFSGTFTSSAKLIRSSKSLLWRVYLPRFVPILSQMLCNGFKTLFSFGVVIILLFWYRIPLSFRLFQLIPLLFLLWLITFGLSSIVAHIGVFLDDINDILPVILRLWMYFTGIFYSIQDKIPGMWGTLLLRLNPLAFILDGLRQTLLYHQSILWSWFFIWFGISCVLCLTGITLLYRYGTHYLKVV